MASKMMANYPERPMKADLIRHVQWRCCCPLLEFAFLAFSYFPDFPVPFAHGMSGITVYHNPQCTKSRLSTTLLQENQEKCGYKLDVVLYKKTPPSVEDLEKLVDLLRANNQLPEERPWDYLLRPEAQNKIGSFEEAFQVIQNDPAMLERPFVIDWDRKIAVLGRPDISRVEKLVADRRSSA